MKAKCKRGERLASENELSCNIFYWGQLSGGIPERDIFPALGRLGLKDESLRAAVGLALYALDYP